LQLLTRYAGALPYLVYDLSSHQHVIEIHIERAPETHHPYNRPVCLCINMVPAAFASIKGTTLAENEHTGTQK
jgi:hypothetical protein